MDEDQATILIRKRIFGPRLNFVGACARFAAMEVSLGF